MGTNYYLVKTCSCGEEETDRIHLGKQAAGWAFCFRGYTKEQLSEHRVCHATQVTNLAEWKDLITQETYSLVDEYGREVTDFLGFVDNTAKVKGKQHAKEFPFSPNKMVDGCSFIFTEFS